MSGAKQAPLLVELGCEELPPLALAALAEAFFSGVCDGLAEAAIDFDREASRCYYTPRRMSLLLAGVADRQPDRVLERKGPSVAAAFDDSGAPTRAATGFATSVGKSVEELERLETDKGEWLFCRVEEAGSPLGRVLFPILESALARLPVPRPMRWSDHEFSFVRPVHWLVVLHGSTVLPGALFGREAGDETRGHRIHAPGPHRIQRAEDYLDRLREARVLVDPDARRATIRQQIEALAEDIDARARITDALLDEVNNLVEWPVAVRCTFDPQFLDVPPEALVASMESHQKFFPLLGKDGKLTHHFAVVANLESGDVDAMSRGFERVIRPRLADAQFFWEQDLKQPLAAWATALDRVVFQKQLGTVGDKSRRIAELARQIAELTGHDPVLAQRAGETCKLDLISQMVGEFPELQGTMGAYYLERAGEDPQVAVAAGEHYRPRYSGDAIPSTPTGQIVALADRLDTLVGIFAAGLKPSGNKDPFALRRSALGVIRILEEAPFTLSLDHLVDLSAETLRGRLTIDGAVRDDVMAFLRERLRNHLLEAGASTRQVQAVLAAPLAGLPDLRARLEALAGFMGREEAEALVAANKRIGNILKKQGDEVSTKIDTDLFVLEEEKQLFDIVQNVRNDVMPLFEQARYGDALDRLATLRDPVDHYFDAVMVMDEDPTVRFNRLAQLQVLKRLFDRVADLSRAD